MRLEEKGGRNTEEIKIQWEWRGGKNLEEAGVRDTGKEVTYQNCIHWLG